MSRRGHRGLMIVLVLFLVLASIYSIATPIFEAGDELWHYPFVQHLAAGNGLPIQDPNIETLWEQEGGQPPLYYALAALTTFWIDTRDLPERVWLNPHAKIGIPLAFGNKNMVVHTSAENFPWQGTTLAVHLIRFLSIILSAITVALAYFFALEIKPDKTPATIAAAIVAFNPMFIFISASVNNDNLATMLATLALLQMAQLITRGASFRRFVVIGIVLGLGALTKISNLGLLVVTACVFLYLLWKSRRGDGESGRAGAFLPLSRAPLFRIIFSEALCTGIVVLIAFWWYVRNWMIYGDLLAFNVWVQIAGGRPMPVTLVSLFNEFQGFRISFWGNFGGVNLIAPEWVYFFLDAFTLLAVMGLVIGLARRTLPRYLWLPALWLALIMLSLVRWTWLTMASQGRLIFPAIGAVAILIALGLDGLGKFLIRNSKFKIRMMENLEFRVLNYVLLGFLFLFALLAPFRFIAPAYALPLRFADESRIQNRLGITFNNQAELVGYHLPQKSVKPGEELPLTIYWRARERMPEDFSVYIRLLDAAGESIGRWEAFPGGGVYPTRLWQPGEIIEDIYRIPVSLDARGPSAGRIEVGLFRRVPLETHVARDPRGNVVTPTVARFKIAGQAHVQIANPVDYKFGDSIAMVGHVVPLSTTPGSTLNVKLFWRALKTIDEDYTVFVHLVDANGKIVAQKDAPPQNGAYPTSFWETGETIEDAYALVIPRDATPGDHRLIIGVYRAGDGARLSARTGDHIELPVRVGN